jgi:hypothetical protein
MHTIINQAIKKTSKIMLLLQRKYDKPWQKCLFNVTSAIAIVLAITILRTEIYTPGQKIIAALLMTAVTIIMMKQKEWHNRTGKPKKPSDAQHIKP